MAIVYSIDGGADAAKFNINSTSGALTFKVAPDFEAPGDANADNVYEVSVKATDAGGAASSKLVKVTVTDVSENAPPQITSAGAVTVKENATTVMTITATDPDDTTTPPIEPPSGNVLHATTSNFTAQVAAATAGTTILCAAGNYGNWGGTNKAITIAAEPGANVTFRLDLNSGMSGWTMDGGHTELQSSSNGPVRTRAPPFTSTGITITQMFWQGTSNAPKNITIKCCCFTGMLRFDTYPNNLDAMWTIDRCYWIGVGDYVPPDKSSPESCFQLWGNQITLKNCFMYQCLADGVKLSGGSNVTIQDSEFLEMKSGATPSVHSDALQWNGAGSTTIVRSWFHDFEQAVCAFDGTRSNTITDNVIDNRPSNNAAWWICMGADNPASTVSHNTVIGGSIACGSKPSNQLSISIIKDNIGSVDLTGIAGGANGKPTTNTNNIPAGNVVFVGGATPTTYQGYKLAAGSPGKGGSSDGSDTGARIN